MKYMLLIYHEEQAWGGFTEQERQKMYAEYGQFSQEIIASGHHLGGSELHPCSTATSVRVRDGKQLATDGPFAETKEQLGGYYLIEAGNLDEAIAIAARIPSARMGTIEVRPVAEAAVPASV
ncbi:MAG: YciI family protein [Pyrinomonadaceae bacterium]|nr:YciI family protein [Pyrinomonadaceae bacterium]